MNASSEAASRRLAADGAATHELPPEGGVDFDTDPSRWHHWKLTVDGQVVSLAGLFESGLARRKRGVWCVPLADGTRGSMARFSLSVVAI